MPEKFINANCPPIEVAFTALTQLKMQICLDMADQAGQHFKLVANCH